jgi:hypothetical protein
MPDQRLGGSVIGEDGQVVVPGIVTKEWKNGVVALPPVRSVNFVVGIDFGAVVEAVSVTSEGVN